MEDKKFYWLKLKNDFFKRQDIRIVEDMPNGKDYVLFYLKLLLESIEHNGQLRFNDTIPYNEQMLSTITNTNIDIVRSAMQVFTSLNMIEVLDDDTIYMSEVSKMIGSAVNNDNANRQRKFREKKKQESLPAVTESNAEVTERITDNNERLDIDTELEKDTEIEKELDTEIKENNQKKTRTKFTKPTLDEVKEFILTEGLSVDAEAFFNYYESNGWRAGRNKMTNWKSACRYWDRNNKSRPTYKPQQNTYDNPFADDTL